MRAALRPEALAPTGNAEARPLQQRPERHGSAEMRLAMRHLMSPLDFTTEELDMMHETANEIEWNPVA